MSTLPNTRARQSYSASRSRRHTAREQEKHPVLRTMLVAALLAIVLDLFVAYATGADWHDLADPETWVLLGAFVLSVFLLSALKQWRA